MMVAQEPVTIAMFHSMFGLRPVEKAAADRLRSVGHRVVGPDLFAGSVAGGGRRPTIEEGFTLMRKVGLGDGCGARPRSHARPAPVYRSLRGSSTSSERTIAARNPPRDPCAGSSKHRVAAWVFPIFDRVNPREN
jgi:hypothetical protein